MIYNPLHSGLWHKIKIEWVKGAVATSPSCNAPQYPWNMCRGKNTPTIEVMNNGNRIVVQLHSPTDVALPGGNPRAPCKNTAETYGSVVCDLVFGTDSRSYIYPSWVPAHHPGHTGYGEMTVNIYGWGKMPNPCNDNNGGCNSDATCSNKNGKAVCICKTGFVGDGNTCVSDPCSANKGGCHADAICDGSSGSVQCTCKPGFEGNGKDCKAEGQEATHIYNVNDCRQAATDCGLPFERRAVYRVKGCFTYTEGNDKGKVFWGDFPGNHRPKGPLEQALPGNHNNKSLTRVKDPETGECVAIENEEEEPVTYICQMGHTRKNGGKLIPGVAGCRYGQNEAQCGGVNQKECEQLCEKASACKAYDYQKGNGDGTCRLWNTAESQKAASAKRTFCPKIEKSEGFELKDDIPYYNGQQICGHWFWDNTIGVSELCKKLGYPDGGEIGQRSIPMPNGGWHIGKCNNASDFPDNCDKVQSSIRDCPKAGERGGFKVKCNGEKEEPKEPEATHIYNVNDCRQAATDCGLPFERRAVYRVKGCFTYTEGNDKGKVFWGDFPGNHRPKGPLEQALPGNHNNKSLTRVKDPETGECVAIENEEEEPVTYICQMGHTRKNGGKLIPGVAGCRYGQNEAQCGGVNQKECEQLCEKASACKAYDYQKGNGDGTCRLWNTAESQKAASAKRTFCPKIEKSEGFELKDDIPYYNGQQICGHWFWDNTIGATELCKKMGYTEGEIGDRGLVMPTGGVFIGKCHNASDFPDNCEKVPSGTKACPKHGERGGFKLKCSGGNSSRIF